jgi:CMP-N,N'-diacetyllegionaminic acid synthase
MSYKNNSILAVIPARGGSKSIPKKNLCKVGGMSLVGRAGRLAKSMAVIDEVVLSTDDAQIAREGKNYGVSVPFLRPLALSGDYALSADVWRHAWLASELFFKRRFDISILLEPTSPLRTVEDIELTVKKLLNKEYDAAVTVSPTPAHFTPQKTLVVKEGKVGFYLKDGARYAIRQKIPQYYHRNGICYAVKRKTLIEDRRIMECNCAAVVIKRRVVNIDELFELELAEQLLTRTQ